LKTSQTASKNLEQKTSRRFHHLSELGRNSKQKPQADPPQITVVY